MSDNVLDFYQIGKRNQITICTNCVHFKNAEANDKSRSEIWYNHLCLAHPLPKSINFVTGIEQYYIENDIGKIVFTDQEFKYCKDINDGKCQKYIQLNPTK